MTKDLQKHWEKIYKEKGPQEVSWTQEKPEGSLSFIHERALPQDAAIIDVGGGDSKLVDFLLNEGYTDLSVLDLSAKALEKAQERLGETAQRVEWIVADATEFNPSRIYDFWHDRATFHFLTESALIQRYVQLVEQAVRKYLLIGTFSDQGPEKCSGLPVEQYDEEKIERTFSKAFDLIKTWREIHITPKGEEQGFIFAAFQRTR
ncbi:MAG: trans-aconitate 2-methyltransferase [Flavobacteriales bacterium]